jgi:adenosylcobinamide-GDP ribazoletransferase
MFTIIPVRMPGTGDVDEELASRAIRWLPAVGLLISAPAAVLLLAVEAGGSGGASGDTLRRLLGAALAVAVLAVITGGLHLDGLADTTDGLASRRPAAEALDIMRRGDTGPLGVTALLFAVLLQVIALAALPGRLAVPGLVLGVVTARVAVILATGPGLPAARPGGFGALVAGRTPAVVCASAVLVLLATVATYGGLAGGTALTTRLLTATAVALVTATALCRAARGQLGGLTGDVFGAVIEVTMTTTLVTLALVA